MRYLLYTAFVALFLTACSTYDKKDLYGSWKNSSWEFTFKEDGSCTCGKEALIMPCTYRTTGNSMEINATGFQLSNLTIKGIKNDTLTMEMRSLGTPITERLARVK